MSRPFRNRFAVFGASGALLLIAASALAFIVQTIPVHIGTSSSAVSGGTGFSCTVTVQSAPCEDSFVMVDTDRPDLLASPSGGWPYKLSVPQGASSAAFKVQTTEVDNSESASLIAYD